MQQHWFTADLAFKPFSLQAEENKPILITGALKMEHMEILLVVGGLFMTLCVQDLQANVSPTSKGGYDENGEWTDPFTYPNGTRKVPPTDFRDGPMPTISDSLFSLIILIYVGVIFVFMFFAFCWKEPEPPPPDPAHKNIPMITSMLDEMEKQEAAKAAAAAEEAADDNTEIEATEMKELNNDKLNVISEKNETVNNGNGEAATTV